MKKSLLFLAAATMGAACFAQDFSVTMAEEKPFEFSTKESYVTIFLGEETRTTNIPDANYIYIGPDPDNGRNLWVWEDTYNFPTASDLNSFGIPGEYMSVQVVPGTTWSGLGYNIAKTNPINLSFIDSEWGFHMAVKTQYTGPLMFNLTDGTGTEAHLVFGDTGSDYDGHAAIANFPRDGEWYNIDIPMSWLEDQFEFTFEGNTKYADKNYFVVCCGGVEGTIVDYDAVFFHGPKVDPGMIDGVQGIRTAADNTTVYDLAGRRTTATRKGIYVQGGKKVLK